MIFRIMVIHQSYESQFRQIIESPRFRAGSRYSSK